MGASFLAQNGGKKSVTLNLKSEGGRDVLRRLVKSCRRAGRELSSGRHVAPRNWLRRAATFNPELVYCAISGYGQDGPMKDAPAYDQIIQGLSGVMSITGDEHCAPLRVGYPIADTIGGITAAFAVPRRCVADSDRRGRIHRCLDAGLRARDDGLDRLQLPDRGTRARLRWATTISPPRRRVRSRPERTAQHRGEQAGTVRSAGRSDRTQQSRTRSALRRAREPQDESHGADGRNRSRARSANRRTNGRRCSIGSEFPPAAS